VELGKFAKSTDEDLTLTFRDWPGDKRLNDWVRIMPLAAQANLPPYRIEPDASIECLTSFLLAAYIEGCWAARVNSKCYELAFDKGN
jgi:hypothetical protein